MAKHVGVWCEFVCEGCSYTTAGTWVFNRDIPRSAMLKDAHEKGWVRKGSGMLCRKCAQDTKEQGDE